MARHVFDHDKSIYDLTSLQLEDAEIPLSKSIGNTIRTFKVIGNGGFGSIYVGTIRKASTHMFFQADNRYLLLGYYHGALLAVHPTNEHSLKVLRQGSVFDSVPIKVAVKRIEVMAEHELIREASNLKVLRGRRNFVTIYGPTKSQDLGCVCLVMDFVPGSNLNKFLQTRGTALFNLDGDEEGTHMCRVWESNEILWWMEKVRLFREIVISLIVCHSQKVFHGDLKGANILLDKTLVPKMVDFGLSFRRTDASYLRSVGGSLFWSAPEVNTDPADASEIYENEIVSDPYPSDVYSLGMLLAEIMLDGNIKDSFTDVEYFLADKLEDGCPVSLDHVRSQNTDFTSEVLESLKTLIGRCCKAERIERIPLQECLIEVNDIFSKTFSFCSPSECSRLYGKTDHDFTVTAEYKDMILKFEKRFNKVPQCIVLSPSWNMAMDEEENRLVHYFCKLDYAEGVKYILEKRTWGFQAERDIAYLALICVTEESIQTLRYLAVSWPDVMEKQAFLPHKACLYNNREMLEILLDAKIDFDTWEEEIIGKDPQGGWNYRMKPIHKFAASGKTEMVRMILDNCQVDPGYVNTTTPLREVETPLYYAIEEGDNVETVRFLVERGGIISQTALLKRQDLDLYHSARSGRALPGYFVMNGLRIRAEQKGYMKVLEFLKRLSPSSVESSFGIDVLPDPLTALRIRAEEKGHVETLDFLKMLYPSAVKASFGIDRHIGTHPEILGVTSGEPVPPAVSGVGKSYANRILADFETGVSEEVICLHFHIEFPAWLADACCQKGYLGILQFLEESCGLDLILLKENYPLRTGYLLHTAAEYGHANIVRFLLRRGYSVDSPFFYLGCSPLHRAIESSKLNHNQKKEMVAVLLDEGADPNFRDKGGYTSMDRVYGYSSKGSRDLARLLLEAGFDCGQKNRWGEDYMDLIAQIGTRDRK